MNTQPREPFDAEEARLKRTYDALPHGEPSAALDARILAHARAAAHKSPKRRRPWFLGAGFGTAAAAVFAAGIAWQLGVFKGERNLSTAPAEAPAAQEELDRIDIEFVKQERKQDEEREAGRVAPKPQQAAAAVAAAAPGTTPLETAPPSAAAPTAPPPPPALASALEDHPSQPAVMSEVQAESPAPRRRHWRLPPSKPGDNARQEATDTELSVLPEPQPFPTETSTLAEMPSGSDQAAPMSESDGLGDRTRANKYASEVVLGSRRVAKEAALPPWTEDVRLAPEAWLERIRDRVQNGDRQDAQHSLRRFVLEHPQRRVPRDLQRLLVE